MGRKRKYHTIEEKAQANCEKSMRYYWKHQKECQERCKLINRRAKAKKLTNENVMQFDI
jgi:hypothetical protein